ncbi:MAG: 3-hydroxyacyl-CoA dehydrogenase NAD-binding domain-containing protein [Candidatus Melainabacteria bacterium]
MTKAFEHIGIVGAGAMGAGIAQVMLQAGLRVTLTDTCPDALTTGRERVLENLTQSAAKGRIETAVAQSAADRLTTAGSLDALKDCTLVIEAASENPDIKSAIFKTLDALCPPATLLASNTSSLSLTAIAGQTQHPGRVAGMHFFNPAPHMKLVEIIAARQSSDETLSQLTAFAQSLGKVTVRCEDTPGFIVNRVARPYYGEALKVLQEHGNDPAWMSLIDTVLREAGEFRMGPFELMDLIGLDVNLAVSESVYNAYYQEPRYRPSLLQQRMVASRQLGRKTGQGFYTYAT